ncbi:MAG: DNA-directed RNA polymerase subunit omega [bacterium]|nr:DNA-directed RNA polymerase subunit omega [bacterium]
MNVYPIDEVYKKVKNKYLAVVLIAKRAKKYNQENYINFSSKGEEPPANLAKNEPLKDAFNDFFDNDLEDRIKSNE